MMTNHRITLKIPR